MQLVLTRKITYHLFRTYLPSGLFVIIGWFSLFIPLDHVPGRVTMGMTTLLTLAAMFSAIATTTPRVSYRYEKIDRKQNKNPSDMTACAIATPRSGKGPRLGASLVCPTPRRKKTAEGEPFLQLEIGAIPI